MYMTVINVHMIDYCIGRLCRNRIETLMAYLLEDKGADLFSCMYLHLGTEQVQVAMLVAHVGVFELGGG